MVTPALAQNRSIRPYRCSVSATSVADLLLVGDVEGDGVRDRADALGHRVGRVGVQVGDHHGGGALGGEPARQRRADAAGSAGDHHDPVGEVHADAPTESVPNWAMRLSSAVAPPAVTSGVGSSATIGTSTPASA